MYGIHHNLVKMLLLLAIVSFFNYFNTLLRICGNIRNIQLYL